MATTKQEQANSDLSVQKSLKKFFCPCCNIGYMSSEDMIDHIKKSPIKVKTYSCNVCLLEFFVKSDLIDHQRVDHQMAVHKKYKCDECDLDYTTMAQLARHKRMHEEIAQKLAASGIFLPRPGKGDTDTTKVSSDEGVSTLQPPSRSAQKPTSSAVRKTFVQNGIKTDHVDKKDTCNEKIFKRPTDNEAGLVIKQNLPEEHIQCAGVKGKTVTVDSKVTDINQEKTSICAISKTSRPALLCNQRNGEDKSNKVKEVDGNKLFACGLKIKAERREMMKQRRPTRLREKYAQTSAKKAKEDQLKIKKFAEIKIPKQKKLTQYVPRMKRYGERTFKFVAPHLWNSLPLGLRINSDYDSFKKDLKNTPVSPSLYDLLNEDGSIRCPDCDVMCSSLNGLNRHRKFHFRTVDKLKCIFCDAEFRNRIQMGNHMTMSHPLKKYQQAYMLIPEEQQFSCTEPGCTQVFTASISLTKHKTKDHGIDKSSVNICEDCGKRFPSRSALTVHRRMHTDERPFKCDLCPKAYRASSSLVLHRKSHSDKKPFVCEYCGGGFTCPNSLRRHTRCRHTGEKPYMCDGCGATFTDHSQLAQHAKTQGHGQQSDQNHPPTELPCTTDARNTCKLSFPGQYCCELCGKQFRTEFGIKSHKEKCAQGHPGSSGTWRSKPVICEVCGREFTSKLNLKNHMVTHTDERPHKCRFCEATFRHYKSKYSHEKVHKGRKDFICAMCGKGFYQRINLKTHMTSHNNTKDLACGLCGKKFNSDHNRKRHEKRCKNYLKCPICSAIFRVHHRLVRHLNLNHSGMETAVRYHSSGRQVVPALDKIKSTNNSHCPYIAKMEDVHSIQPSEISRNSNLTSDQLSQEKQYIINYSHHDKLHISSELNHYQDKTSPSHSTCSFHHYTQAEIQLIGNINRFQAGELHLMTNNLSPSIANDTDQTYPTNENSPFMKSQVNRDDTSHVIANNLSTAVVYEVNRSPHSAYLF